MLILIRGGGDLASGVALRLWRAGLRVVICELPQPLAVRRLVSFSEAVYTGEVSVEEVKARRINDPQDSLQILTTLGRGYLPVLVDPQAEAIGQLHPLVVVDARMTKQPVELPARQAGVALWIGLGPGFTAGENCDCAIETQRGHLLGRVYWQGGPLADTGIPDPVLAHGSERVLRAPASGELRAEVELGALIEAGQQIASVAGQPVTAPFRGALRGLLPGGLVVRQGMKIGDLDPRADTALCRLVSEKALAIAGGVLEAMLTHAQTRKRLGQWWGQASK